MTTATAATTVVVGVRNHQAEECQRRLCISLEKVSQLTDADPTRRALILSGGVDTCAILEAAASIQMTFAVAITVVIGDESPDEAFATHAALQHKLDHSIVRMTADELVQDYLPRTIKLLETFDGMTIRNSLVISAAFQEAKRLGMKHVVVGDGADELFGGYSFMWGNADDPSAWKEKRDSMCQKWTFATPQLASSFGIQAHGPFMDDDFVDWALTSTSREDCIGEMPIKLTLNSEPILHAVGKVVLREAFETCSSWRRKDPIEVGSGATVIGKDEYWADQVSDEEFYTAQKDFRMEGLEVRSKEHLVNLRSYIKVFGGIVHPTKKRMPMGEGCVGCRFEIGDAMFCYICGAWPAQRSKATNGTED